MGKSSKRKNPEKPSVGFVSSNQVAASIYAAKNGGRDISKEDLTYLKFHLRNGGGLPAT